MPEVIISPSHKTTIPALSAFVDGYPDIEHKLTATVSSVPLEDGANATDHISPDPEQLDLRGWVSDLSSFGSDRAIHAFQLLKRIHENGDLIRVLTPWHTYEDMAVRRLDARQKAGAMEFALRLVRVRRVGAASGGIYAEEVGGPAERRTSIVERGIIRAVESASLAVA